MIVARRRLLLGAALLLACSVTITWLVAVHGTPGVDRSVNDAARSVRDAWFTHVLRLCSWLGYASRIIPIVIVLDIVLMAHARRAPAAAVSLAAIIGLVSFAVTKRIAERPRPPHPDHVVAGWSMPSGHATITFAIAVALIVAVPVLRSRWWRAALVLAWPVLTAASRVVLGVHFLTDVLAGALLGSAAALIACAIAGVRPRTPAR